VSFQSVMVQIRRAKEAAIRAEEEMETLLKVNGIKMDAQPKPPGRPLGSKNRPKQPYVGPQSTQEEMKAG
jgi:hypothetical protein